MSEPVVKDAYATKPESEISALSDSLKSAFVKATELLPSRSITRPERAILELHSHRLLACLGEVDAILEARKGTT